MCMCLEMGEGLKINFKKKILHTMNYLVDYTFILEYQFWRLYNRNCQPNISIKLVMKYNLFVLHVISLYDLKSLTFFRSFTWNLLTFYEIY